MNAARGVRPGGWGGFHPMLRTGGLSIRPLQKNEKKKLVRFILILFGHYSGLVYCYTRLTGGGASTGFSTLSRPLMRKDLAVCNKEGSKS